MLCYCDITAILLYQNPVLVLVSFKIFSGLSDSIMYENKPKRWITKRAVFKQCGFLIFLVYGSLMDI